ncbi:hypothetical protein C6A37_06105 [Desulfobacteraceae bacterium SEEP-SAG9]|nr:hypothetical protein C6A37_06105 [Desulfobacteraceae bacterium SEEP-SAG9]
MRLPWVRIYFELTYTPYFFILLRGFQNVPFGSIIMSGSNLNLEIFHIFKWLKYLPLLALDKIERFGMASIEQQEYKRFATEGKSGAGFC